MAEEEEDAGHFKHQLFPVRTWEISASIKELAHTVRKICKTKYEKSPRENLFLLENVKSSENLL